VWSSRWNEWQGNDECGAVGGMIGRGMMRVEQSVE
jgi:hypothetical protein